MKYKYKLSHTDRLTHQYTGFISTANFRFWDENIIKLFDFPLPGKVVEGLAVADNTVLGKRAEAFFSAMILNSEEYILEAAQIQLIKEGVTIGELDFLIREITTKKLIHVELAYKFYLLDSSDSDDLAAWVGPNRRDSLDKKWLKLSDYQFPKIQSPSAGIIFDELGLDPSGIEQQLCMPMQLFIPFGESIKSMEIFREGFSGSWMSFEQFNAQTWAEFSFFIPEKEDWFVNPKECEIWMSQSEILPQISENISNRRSPLVWLRSGANVVNKLFVTFW